MNIELCFVLFFVLSHLVVLSLAWNDSSFVHPECPPFECGTLGLIRFPFNNESLLNCGLYTVKNCSAHAQPKIQLKREGGLWFDVVGISQANVIHINDTELKRQISSRNCSILNDLALTTSPVSSLSTDDNVTIYNCTENPKDALPLFISSFTCPGYYTYLNFNTSPSCTTSKSRLSVPVRPVDANNSYVEFTGDFQLQVTVSSECHNCFNRKGECLINQNKFDCKGGKAERRKGIDFYINFQ